MLQWELMGKGRTAEGKFTGLTNGDDVMLHVLIQDLTSRDFTPLLGTSSDRCLLPSV